MNKGKQLAVGGLLLAIFSIMLLITIYVPVVGVLMMFILPIPFIFIALENSLKWSFVFLVAACFLTVILGHILSVPLTLMMGSIGTTIGFYLRTGKSHLQMYILSVLLFIANMLFIFYTSMVLMDINYIDKTIERMNVIIEQSERMFNSIGQNEESIEMLMQFKESMQLVEVLLPSLIVIASTVLVGVIIIGCKPIINRFSSKKILIAPLRQLQLPKSLLWYYLFTMIASLFIGPSDGIAYTVVFNLLFCMQFFVMLQGYSFLFYISNKKKWHTFIPIIAVVLSILLPFASIVAPLIRILGIIDLGFSLREKL